METRPNYLMENTEEIARLERKTDPKIVLQQAIWAGLKPGMRVADIGCGSGKTTHALYQAVQPGGQALGVDMSEERLAYARDKYAAPGLRFVRRNALETLKDLGTFDFVWVRFFLEYHRSQAFDIVKNLSNIIKPGGILCLIDLDYNCLNHFGMPDRLARAMRACMRKLEREADFDPYVGIKLYSFLYDLGFEGINVAMAPHHLIFGELNDIDAYNWTKKIEVAFKRTAIELKDYPGGYAEFFQEFKDFFTDPRRFSYTPLIACRGSRPLEANPAD